MCRRITALLVAAVVGALGVGTSSATAHAAHHVRYLGLRVSVPAAWPVVDLTRHPGSCVRFDRHAVYLGRPAAVQRCRAKPIGRTEALLLQPAAGARPVGTGATLRRGRVLVTATWREDARAIRRALGVRRLPAPATPPPPAARTAAASRAGHVAAVTTGLGFDPCATPSEATMRAWLSSPYRAVGVYLGGQNMACAQPNLTSRWVADETAAGWHFIPAYVGLQAPGTSCGCATINPGQAASQGRAAASDAIGRARAVGLGSGNPIYFDMEAYANSASATRTALTFLSAWTAALHAAGYLSGVYSSGASGITDLVNAVGSSHYTSPDDIWIADWNGRHTVSDPYVPSGDWPTHQRIHQFSGNVNETYGGVTLNIDGDYVDGATAAAGSSIRDGTFVTGPDGHAVYRVAGGAPLPVTSWTPFGGPRPLTTLSAAQFAALGAVPLPGTFLSTAAAPARTTTSSTTTTGSSGGSGVAGGGSGAGSATLYRVAGGAALPVTNPGLFGPAAPNAVAIDPADLTIAGQPGSHLYARPESGTVVTGLPSGSLWTFTSAGRYATSPGGAAAAAAVTVDDAALAAYPVVPAPVSCVVPQLHRLTVARARAALARAHCALGAVHRPRRVRRAHLLRVHAQRPSAGARRPAGHTVNLALL